ncbi:MAG: BON domain-containing protein [Bacillota bacterium]
MSHTEGITREEVAAALNDVMEISALDINVDVIDGNRVILHGVVDVLAEKHKAEAVVRSLPGVKAVENSLAVSTDGNVEDGGIKNEIENKLRANPRVRNLGVEVHKGIVTLHGHVQHIGEAKAAMHTAESALGVKGVHNDMELEDETPDGATLVNTIEHHLSQHHLSSNVDARAHRGIVTLVGFAEDGELRALAQDIAENVRGVRQVINKIEIDAEKAKYNP